MRDRLMELLRNAPKTDTVYGDIKLAEPVQTLQTIVDHLLANGVIVPPCKVGDTVYKVNYRMGSYYDYTVKAIYFTEDKKYYPKPHILAQHEFAHGRVRFNFTDFGKTLFLTREAAEKALAERSENEHRTNTQRS